MNRRVAVPPIATPTFALNVVFSSRLFGTRLSLLNRALPRL